jgi:hypothetical protein
MQGDVCPNFTRAYRSRVRKVGIVLSHNMIRTEKNIYVDAYLNILLHSNIPLFSIASPGNGTTTVYANLSTLLLRGNPGDKIKWRTNVYAAYIQMSRKLGSRSDTLEDGVGGDGQVEEKIKLCQS